MLHALFGLAACGALAATYSLAALAGATNTHTRPAAAPAAHRAASSAAAAKTSPAASDATNAGSATASKPDAPPSAAEFAEQFVGTASAYASEHGDAVRLGRAHCVQASPGHYMCSYQTQKPGQAAHCHVVQARWTPDAASTFTVTLSGRAARCGTLRAALRSLQ